MTGRLEGKLSRVDGWSLGEMKKKGQFPIFDTYFMDR